MPESAWTVVRRGKRSTTKPSAKYLPSPRNTHPNHTHPTKTHSNPPHLIQLRIEKHAQALSSTSWWQGTLAILRDTIQNNTITTLYCIGLGSFTNSRNARHQLACALLLKKIAASHANLVLSDPAMTSVDAQISSELGFQIAQPSDNTFANLAVFPSEPPDGCCTLWFLPHCPRRLNEAVFAQCSHFNFTNSIFFANHLLVEHHFFKIDDRRLHPTLYSLKTNRRLKERLLPSEVTSTLETAFNDLCITTVRSSLHY